MCAFALLDFLQLFNSQLLHIMGVLEASWCGIAPHQSLLGAIREILRIPCLMAGQVQPLCLASFNVENVAAV